MIFHHLRLASTAKSALWIDFSGQREPEFPQNRHNRLLPAWIPQDAASHDSSE
jgi:hypothetical protein